MLRENIPRALILEDDAVLPKNISEILDRELHTLDLLNGRINSALACNDDKYNQYINCSAREQKALSACKPYPSKYIGDLVQMPDVVFLVIRRLGRKSLKKIKKILKEQAVPHASDVMGWIRTDDRK